MSCESCREALEVDDETPDCRTEKGCRIPPLDETGRRVLHLRSLLIDLRDLVDPGTVLMLNGATAEDLEMLAEVGKKLRRLFDKEKGEKGDKSYDAR